MDIIIPIEKNEIETSTLPCAYQKLIDLTEEERHPKKSPHRHIVDPPSGGKITLVCCETTVGPFSVAVHTKWAPLGAERFLELVRNKYFSTRVALMRCIKNFICQFGIAGDPSINKMYESKNILDDPNWLPEGPTNRVNADGTKRFSIGYMAYAGGGPNTRSNQFIVALKDNAMLGGGSPWEVPFGEVVGKESFDVLSKIYTGYGENGPPQHLLAQEGSSKNVKDLFPALDYVTACTVIDEEIN